MTKKTMKYSHAVDVAAEIASRSEKSPEFKSAYEAARADIARINAYFSLISMTPERRLVILLMFCADCGSDDHNCQCANDE